MRRLLTALLASLAVWSCGSSVTRQDARYTACGLYPYVYIDTFLAAGDDSVPPSRYRGYLLHWQDSTSPFEFASTNRAGFLPEGAELLLEAQDVGNSRGYAIVESPVVGRAYTHEYEVDGLTDRACADIR